MTKLTREKIEEKILEVLRRRVGVTYDLEDEAAEIHALFSDTIAKTREEAMRERDFFALQETKRAYEEGRQKGRDESDTIPRSEVLAGIKKVMPKKHVVPYKAYEPADLYAEGFNDARNQALAALKKRFGGEK